MAFFSNSIFKKKGTVESLFRFGLGDASDEDRPVPVAQAQADAQADGRKRHEVYSVRGRPFIATVQGNTPKSLDKRSPPKRATPATARDPLEVSSAATPTGRVTASPMPRPPRSARRGTSALASGPQIEDEEWAAYFRNNLLKSCWKPGLRNEEVQRILTLAERKLVEVIHRWTHPGIWIAYKLWKRRTWKLDRLQFIIMRARHYKERKAWEHWTKMTKLRTLHPFVDQQRMQRKLRLWHRKAMKLKALHCSSKAAPFKQFKERTLHMANRKRLLRKAAAGFKSRDDARAFNKWCEVSQRRHTAAARSSVSLSSWARGSEKRAINQWHAIWVAHEPVRLVYQGGHLEQARGLGVALEEGLEGVQGDQ